MTKTCSAAAGGIAAVLAVWVAACGEPQCPRGYYKEDGRCYLVRDAGSDAAASDGGEGMDAEVDGDDAGPGSGPAPAEDAAVDERGMSACDVECRERETCVLTEGLPTCACQDGYEACDDGCADLVSDPSNCGSCGYACETGLSCKQGECEQKIRELVLGGDSSCALYDSPDGRYPVKCWGDTSNALFRDAATQALSPRSVVGVPVARALTLADDFQCAVPPERDVARCWGTCGIACGNTGAVATSDAFFDSDVPAIVTLDASGSGQKALAATCALTSVRRPFCWGNAALRPGRFESSVPEQAGFSDAHFFLDLSLGGAHGCAVTRDGALACWGTNTFNQLGVDSDPAVAGTVVSVTREDGALLEGALDVEAGAFRTCAITEQHELWCWGHHNLGSLGVGDADEHTGAVKVELPDVTGIAVGYVHACAIVRNGQAYCWGAAPFAGLGGDARGDVEDGAFFSRPQPVLGLDDALEIRVGTYHTCARRRSGQVVCWGPNEAGQLGDGTTVARLSPTPVTGLY